MNTKPGYAIAGLVGLLKWWLLAWSTWEHPLFWYIMSAMLLLVLVQAVVQVAEKAGD